MYFSDFLNGFLIELGLVMTVGLQSAFILKQGIRREYVIIAVLTCFFGETLLVTIGIAGMGALVRSIPNLYQIVTGIGIIFLLFYGIKSFYSAITNNDYIVIDSSRKDFTTRKEVLLTGLAFALLNPHVIIDTTMMGSLSANFYPHQWIFGAGVYTAAFVWYAFLGTVGATLAKPLNKPVTWKIINVLIGIMCLYMAAQFFHNFNQPAHDHSHINLFSVFGVESHIADDLHNHNHDDEHHNDNTHNNDLEIQHNKSHEEESINHNKTETHYNEHHINNMGNHTDKHY